MPSLKSLLATVLLAGCSDEPAAREPDTRQTAEQSNPPSPSESQPGRPVLDGDDWLLDGTLTIKGVSKPVSLEVEFEGAGQDPWGNGRIAFSAEGEINRDDFGINWNQALETGGVLVGKTVKISIDVQAVAG